MPEVMYRVAREYDVVTVKVSAESEKRIERLRSEGRCLGCEEKLEAGERVSRGLCGTCYHGARYAIRKKRTTEGRLIKEGKMLTSNPGGRRPANKFTRELSER